MTNPKNPMNEVTAAFQLLKSAMVFDDPSQSGSYAHAWHCNIAMMIQDALADSDIEFDGFDSTPHSIANDAASRFMKLCFDVETKA